MKTPILLVQAALVGLSLAQLSVIQTAISSVQKTLGDLDTSIKGINGADINSATPIVAKSQAAQQVISQATTQVKGAQTLSLTDALSLQQTASGLTTAVNTTFNDLVAKKPDLDMLGVTNLAVQTLQQQKAGAGALGNAIVSKVPAIGQGIAQQSIGQISTSIDAAIKKLQAPPAAGTAGARNSTRAAVKFRA